MAAESELDLRDYLGVLRRHRVAISLTAVLVVAITTGLSLAQPNVYEGRSRVLLEQRATDFLFGSPAGLVTDRTRAVRTELEVIKSQPVRELVQAKLGRAPKVSASSVGLTDVVEIRARSKTPVAAAQIANAYADAYISFRRSDAVNELLAAAEQIRQKIVEIQVQIDSAETRAIADPATRPQRDALIGQQSLFKQKLDQLQVDASIKTGGARRVAQAVVSQTPVSPTPVRNGVLSFMFGGLLGIGVAFLAEYLDDSISTSDDLARATGGLSTLAMIPTLGSWRDRDETHIISREDPRSPGAEAYRAFRTTIQFLNLDHNLKLVQVTSPLAAEGKTTTLVNLATVLAGVGQRVILVDCDLRRPRIHKFFGLSNEIGFTSLLLGHGDAASALQPVPGIENLVVLTSGPPPPNPSELLWSKRTAAVLAELESLDAIVLIDSPPVLPVTDASVLAKAVDGLILVVNSGDTSRRQLTRTLEVLRQVEAPLLGAVLNQVADAPGYGYAYGSPSVEGHSRQRSWWRRKLRSRRRRAVAQV